MKKSIILLMVMIVISAILCGCGNRSHGKETKVKANLDIDVTFTPEYNFKTFVGTVWKTKVNVALGEMISSNGIHHITMLDPENFDPKHPNFTSPPSLEKIITELPKGTRLRIEKLMEDSGNWGGVRVLASLENGKSVYLSVRFLAKNRFVWRGDSDSVIWGVNHELLEPAS